MNKVFLAGNLGKDVEIRKTKADTEFASFSVATNDGYYDSDGKWVELVEWHQVITFQKGLVAMLQKHGKKGRKVAITGSLKTNTFRKDGEDSDRRATEVLVGIRGEIEFLDTLPASNG